MFELSYRGINHCIDNTFIYAPRQKVLMLIDVIYPGWMPYKNLGVTVDVPGFVNAHYNALAFDFETLVAGQVSRLGARDDVKVQLTFLQGFVAGVRTCLCRALISCVSHKTTRHGVELEPSQRL